MREKLFLMVGFLALLVAAQNAEAGTITMTGANDSASLNTGSNPITDMGWGAFHASVSGGSANASLDVVRTDHSLDYAWGVTPSQENPSTGAQTDVYETFSLSASSAYELTVTGAGCSKLYFQNTGTLEYLTHYGTGKPSTGDTPVPATPFTLSGELPAGTYALTARMGQVPPFPALTGTISFNIVPEPSTLALLGIGAISLLAYAWRRRGS
jgi:hypothetical protein